MYKSVKEPSLPPHIKGSTRGKLFLSFLELNLKKCFNAIELRILWWGDSFESSVLKNLVCEKSPFVISPNELIYNINTNTSLFHSYLRSAESIEIKLASEKTKTPIGTVFASIPEELISNKENRVCCTKSYQIFNNKNQIIGHIKLQFKMIFKLKNENITDEKIPNRENIDKKDSNISLKITKNNLKLEKENIVSPDLGGLRKYTKFNVDSGIFIPTHSKQSSRSFQELDVSNRTIIMNYLSGESMSKREESLALNELYSVSPPESVIEAISTPLLKNDYITGKISIGFAQIILSNIGYHFMKKYNSNNEKFVFIITPNKSGKKIESQRTNNLNFITFSTSNIKIELRKYLILNIKYSTQSSLNEKNFGYAKVNLQEAINCKILTQKVEIYHNENNIIVGHIVLNFNNFINDVNTLRPATCNHDDQNDNSINSNKSKVIKEDGLKVSKDDFSKTKKDDGFMNSNNDGVKVELKDQREANIIKFLEGLIYIGNLDKVDKRENGSYFIVLHTFWKGTECTQITDNNFFKYLESFQLICNKEFLERMKNNFLVLELWQKDQISTEKLVGNILMPLHKFYVALSDPTSYDQMRLAKFPVISIDGWSPITSPLSNSLYGQIELVFAIGTKEQIDTFKMMRNLNATQPLQQNINHVETQTSNIDLRTIEIQTNLKNDVKSPKTVAVDKLNAFIESLAQLRTPKGLEIDTTPLQKSQQIRKTSELLDMLQIALAKAPPIQTPPTPAEIVAPMNNFSPVQTPQQPPTTSPPIPKLDNLPDCELFNVIIEIENATSLPKTIIRQQNLKKNGTKRGKNSKNNRNMVETEPSSYVTFNAFGTCNNLLKSHEGPVHATNIVEKSCNPIWNKKFDVLLPVDLLTDESKIFELKILNKHITDQIQCRLTPTPSEDIIIGTSKINLTKLLDGESQISGCFNIVDFSGRLNGQINIRITPHQAIDHFRITKPVESTNSISAVDPNFDSNLSLFDATGLSCTFLSGALKRKFTELEEITQRLKSRLQDVTDEETIDLDDEFENDLNTVVDEDDDSSNWPKFEDMTFDHSNEFNRYDIWNKTNDNSDGNAGNQTVVLPSTSGSSSSLSITQERVTLISDNLKKTRIEDDSN